MMVSRSVLISLMTGSALVVSAGLAMGDTSDSDRNYAKSVRTTLDNLIEHGRDRYGKEHSPMFAAILDADTLECPENPPRYPVLPIRMDPGRPWQRSPAAANQFFDQATFRSMALMSRITGDPKYRQAVLEALKFNLNKAVDKRGFPVLGGHTRWNLYNDQIDANGHHHELWHWPMAWELWYAADPGKMKEYADKIWEWHVVDKETGETNRHADKQHGWSFTLCDGTLMSSWAFMATKSPDPKYKRWCEKVADYHWNRRNRQTGLHPSSGGKYGISRKRYDTSEFTTCNINWARQLIQCGRQVRSEELIRRGRAVLDSYARYGYDSTRGLFYAQLTLDGTPVKADVQRDLVTGNGEPVGYLAVWLPDSGWQELPLITAQAYAWAAETVDREAYLPTARRFGRILARAWKERYAGYKDWFAYRDALKPFALDDVTKPGQTRKLRHAADCGADPRLLAEYRKGGYVYQAPYGLFADHYGRAIQFSLSMHRLTGDDRWMKLAVEMADAALSELWRGKIFVGHVSKQHYMASDQVGILLFALLQLDDALGEKKLDVQPYF